MDKRKPAAVLAASVALISALALQEDFDPIATIPVPHDPPTYGHGATVKADGTAVQLGDRITRSEARALLKQQVDDKYAAAIRRCAGDIPMLQREFDAAVDLAYNIGWEKVCGSTMILEFRASNYADGCRAIYRFDKLHGRHCSLPENRNRRDGCKGIMARRTKQYNLCMGVAP